MVDALDHETVAPVRLAVIQPSPFCNIDCKYCYLPGRSSHQQMSPKTLEQASRFLFKNPKRVAATLVIAWHSGEPLAVSLDFYESAFDLLEKRAPPSCKIQHWMQTNATLVSQDWCDFMQRWNVKIGVSVDGPRWLHDSSRVDRSGRGTFSRVLRGIELLRSNNINFSTIGVLSARSLDVPEEMWRFYRGLGVSSLAFNFENIEGVHRTSSLCGEDGQIFSNRAEVFFERLMQLRDQEAPDVWVRELDYFVDGIPLWQGDFRTVENVPLCVIGIAWNGDISTFSPELIGMKDPHYGDFVVGNVAEDTLEGITSSPKFQMIDRDIAAGVQQCRSSCEYFCVCGGGSPSPKLYENGTFNSAETLACRLRIKAVGNAVLDFLENKHGVGRVPTHSIRQRMGTLWALLRPEIVEPGGGG